MRKQFLLYISCLLLPLFYGCDDQAIVPEAESTMSAIELEAFQLINQHREAKGLSSLEHMPLIFEVAQGHSADMANGDVPFGHDGIGKRGEVLRSDLSFGGMAENVAYTSRNSPAAHVVDMWLKSKGHRDNIENPIYSHTGLAMIENAEGVYYFTQIFVDMKEE